MTADSVYRVTPLEVPGATFTVASDIIPIALGGSLVRMRGADIQRILTSASTASQ